MLVERRRGRITRPDHAALKIGETYALHNLACFYLAVSSAHLMTFQGGLPVIIDKGWGMPIMIVEVPVTYLVEVWGVSVTAIDQAYHEATKRSYERVHRERDQAAARRSANGGPDGVQAGDEGPSPSDGLLGAP